jgi:uncharacterized delta-60 repeat protein
MRMGGRDGTRIGWAVTLLALVVALVGAADGAAAPLRGELDPSFGKGGRVLFGLGPTFANSSYRAMVRQPDGSLVLGGTTEAVLDRRIYGKFIEPNGFVQRRLADGSLDPGFHAVVKGTFQGGLAVEADGDILYAVEGGRSDRVRRLRPDGSDDLGYGKGGASVPLSIDGRFLAVDGEGRVVVAGSARIGGSCHDCVPDSIPAVSRLLPNGAVDKSFGEGGRLLLPLPNPRSDYRPTGLVLKADGSIVVSSEEAVFGVTATGQIDTAFGKEGVVDPGGNVGALAQTSSGDLVVATTSYDGYGARGRGHFVLYALRPDGSPDPAWGIGGTTSIAVADVDVPTALAPTPDGGVVLAGETAPADEADGCGECQWTPYVARLTAAGTVDPGFTAQLGEPPGLRREVGPTQGYSSRVGAIAVAPSGQVLLAGKSEAVEQAAVVALGPSGAADPAFGRSGTAADQEPLPSLAEGSGLAIGPGGKLVVPFSSNAGAYAERPLLGGWSVGGAYLGGYGGLVQAPRATPTEAVGSDGRGRVYRVEEVFRGPDELVRFDRGGRPDPAFGSAGRAPLPAGFKVEQLVVRRDGTALVVGAIGGQRPMALFELTPAGRPDPSFGKGGLARLGWGKGSKAKALAAGFDRRGRIVLFGVYDKQTPLARLLPSGRLDKSFGKGGRVNFKPLVGLGFSSISVARDGRIYLATSSDRGEVTLARFRDDGSRDPSFGRRGVRRVEGELPLIDLFAGGRQLVLVCGHGTFGDHGFALYGLHLDGRRDRSFGHAGIVEGDQGRTAGFGPVAAVRQANGRIVLAGTWKPLALHAKVELVRFR